MDSSSSRGPDSTWIADGECAGPTDQHLPNPWTDPGSCIHATGVLVPLYYPPGADWNTALSVKTQYLNVPFIFILNALNGPGPGQDSTYLYYIAQFQAQPNTIVLGYVATGYGDTINNPTARGGRPLTGAYLSGGAAIYPPEHGSVESDIDMWYAWYGPGQGHASINGIFFDEWDQSEPGRFQSLGRLA